MSKCFQILHTTFILMYHEGMMDTIKDIKPKSIRICVELCIMRCYIQCQVGRKCWVFIVIYILSL